MNFKFSEKDISEMIEGVWMSDLLSVVVPMHNSSKTIKNCIESIINQTYSNIELIIVDDGSDDDSFDIANEILRRNSFPSKVIRTENRGAFAARNIGIRNACGKWITFVDSDDWIEPMTYECVLDEAGYNAEWISYRYFNGYGFEEMKHRDIYPAGTYSTKDILKNAIYDREYDTPGIFQGIWTKIISTRILNELLDTLDEELRISLGDDALVVYGSLLKSKEIYVSEYVGYHYINQANSLTKKINENIFFEVKNFYDSICKVIEQEDDKYNLLNQVKLYMVHIVMMSLRIGYGIKLAKEYAFPDISNLGKRKIIIYGAGKVGKDYYKQMQLYQDIELKLWVDKRLAGEIVNDYLIDSIESINTADKESLILIAVEKIKLANSIKDELLERGISENRIIWEKPETRLLLDSFDL